MNVTVELAKRAEAFVVDIEEDATTVVEVGVLVLDMALLELEFEGTTN